MQCFDASLFLQMNERKPTWLCPVCDRPAPYDSLVVDGYFQEVLTSPRLSSDCNEIQLLADGSWSAHTPPPRAVTQTQPQAEPVTLISDDLGLSQSITCYKARVATVKILQRPILLADGSWSAHTPPPRAVTQTQPQAEPVTLISDDLEVIPVDSNSSNGGNKRAAVGEARKPTEVLVDLTSDSEDELPLKRKVPQPKATPPITHRNKRAAVGEAWKPTEVLVDLTSDSEDELPLKRKVPQPKATPPISETNIKSDDNYSSNDSEDELPLKRKVPQPKPTPLISETNIKSDDNYSSNAVGEARKLTKVLVDLTSDSEDELPLKRKVPQPKATPPISETNIKSDDNYSSNDSEDELPLKRKVPQPKPTPLISETNIKSDDNYSSNDLTSDSEDELPLKRKVPQPKATPPISETNIKSDDNYSSNGTSNSSEREEAAPAHWQPYADADQDHENYRRY
ncbi:MIZ/SP-RING zinc finger domain-containing protein [Phthorimaea operculella]|nr:MIZ/SP-RING zinc finger domain-containing protein [Phthorimaea operculella]